MSKHFSVTKDKLDMIAQGMLEVMGRATATINFTDSLLPLVDDADTKINLIDMATAAKAQREDAKILYDRIAREAMG